MPESAPIIIKHQSGQLEAKTDKITVKAALDYIEKSLESGGGNMPTYETMIDKKSFTSDDLKRLSKLPIEVFFGHDENMGLHLKTGFSTHVEFESDSWNHKVYGMQLYTAHNHPNDTPIPSFEDLITYSKSDSFYHFILSEKGGVSVIRKPTRQEIMDISKLKHMDYPRHEDFLRALETYLREKKIIEKVVKFEDEEIEMVVKMFRGDLSVDYFKGI